MSADGYLKAAAGQLHSAAQAVKQEADQMHADLANYERQANHEINSKTADMRAYMAEATATSDPTAAQNLNRLAQSLQNDVEDKKRELQQKKSEMTQAMKGKEGTASGLRRQAQGLEGQAGSLK